MLFNSSKLHPNFAKFCIFEDILLHFGSVYHYTRTKLNSFDEIAQMWQKLTKILSIEPLNMNVGFILCMSENQYLHLELLLFTITQILYEFGIIES